MLISIIIPIYNVEKYIEKCIESVISQISKDIEIILVNDGSTDNSGKIINKYKNINNIKIFYKKNGGLSDARNFGIRKASGKYLMFIDGDDYIYNNCLLKIQNAIKVHKSDIIQYKMCYLYGNKICRSKNLELFHNTNLLNSINRLNISGSVSVSACDKVVKKSIILNNNLFFEKNLLSEDIKWSYQLYLIAKNITTLNEDIYIYRQQRTGSISTKPSYKSLCDNINTINYWYNYNYKNQKTKHIYYNLISYWYLIARTIYPYSYYSKQMLRYFKKMDKILFNYDLNYKVKKANILRRVFGFNITIKFMRLYVILKNKGLIRL